MRSINRVGCLVLIERLMSTLYRFHKLCFDKHYDYKYVGELFILESLRESQQ
jgi:hypothetical protein